MLLPAGCIDRAVFIWEQKYFFGGGWTCVGFCAELAILPISAPSPSATAASC
jgi:hypothetical protein